MDRRTFVRACAGSLIIARSGAGAQSAAKASRVGYLTYATPEQTALLLREFTEGLRELGYVEGRNITIERHYGDGTLNRLPDLAADVVRSRVDVIVTGTNPIAAAAKRATATIPIVMVGTFDPVGAGLVANLARPGGNVTGLCVDASAEMSGKNLGLLAEIVPRLSRVGVLRQAGYQGADLEAAAQKLKMELYVVDVRTDDELENAFQTMRRKQVGAVLIRGSLFYVRRQQVADLALKYRLPATHGLREYAQAGLLLTYGANLADLYRRAASYVDRIVKGAKPSDLPVELPTKFELVINLATAKALGLTIPQSLLLRADDVIR
jgi:putative tryptophan/tyrosine transport system substrate-binding protein